MGHIRQWNADGYSDAAGYSHVVESTNDPTVYLCGFASTACSGESPDFEAQVHETLDKIFEVLRQAGLTPADVVRRTTFVVNLTPDKTKTILNIYEKRFAPHSKPAASLIGVSVLAHPDMLVEIECTAVRPPQR